MQKKHYFMGFIFMALSVIYLPTSQAIAATPQIATGFYHNVVLAADGTVWTWGSNVSGQLCDSTRPSPDALPRPIPGLTNATHVAAGSDYTLVVKTDGSVWTCGANLDGQLGRGFTSDYEPDIGQVVDPTGSGYLNLDVGGSGVMAVAAGNNHSLVIRNDGTVWGWGSNYGKLGVDQVFGETTRSLCGGPICTKPVQAENVTNATAIDGGILHSMALDSSGQVWTWGSSNYLGQLGRAGNEFVPATVEAIDPDTGQPSVITGVSAIAAGWGHSLAVSSTGNLYGWGINEAFQVLISYNWPRRGGGIQSLTQPTPVLIPPPSTSLSSGSIIATPPLLTNVVAVSASQSQSLIMTSHGYTVLDSTGNSVPFSSVTAWGKNSLEFYENCDASGCVTRVLSDFRGVLGLGNELDYTKSSIDLAQQLVANYPPPAPLWGSNDTVAITAIEVGRLHSLALRADGTIYVSGLNGQYQLANPNPSLEFTSYPTAVQMLGITCSPSRTDFNFDISNPPIDCDFDGDGVPYATDNCPSLFNDDQADSDGNGIGDACDTPCSSAGGDSDGDGICTDNDNCPGIANSPQIDTDVDGIGDVCDDDADADGVLNTADNCPLSFGLSPDQTDTDGDGIGDVCDDDDDNDGVLDNADQCDADPNKVVPGACGCGVADTDADSSGSADCLDDPPDIDPPVIISGPSVLSITNDSAVIEWTTDESSTGNANFGTTDLLGNSIADATLGTSHSVTLTGLTPETVYFFNVDASDWLANGPTTSGTLSFNTVAVPDTSAPQIIEGPMVVYISDVAATVVWTTDEPATSGIFYDDGTTYEVASDTTLVTEHSILLEGLTISTLYNFTVSSVDVLNNGPALSKPGQFTTLEAVRYAKREKGKKCYDGVDNDRDGLTDGADPDCGGEGKGKTCYDGLDNDVDGFIDCADSGCSSSRVCR